MMPESDDLHGLLSALVRLSVPLLLCRLPPLRHTPERRQRVEAASLEALDALRTVLRTTRTWAE